MTEKSAKEHKKPPVARWRDVILVILRGTGEDDVRTPVLLKIFWDDQKRRFYSRIQMLKYFSCGCIITRWGSVKFYCMQHSRAILRSHQ